MLTHMHPGKALMKNATDAMKESRIPDFLALVGTLSFLLVALLSSFGFFMMYTFFSLVA